MWDIPSEVPRHNMIYQKPTGTRDFFPEDMGSRKRVFNSLKAVADSYGFREIESPAFEDLGFLKAKSGEEILGQLFTIERKGSGNEAENFGLRFDMTVPAARMFVEKQKSIPKPVKWYYLTRMWRYERPQKGRLREFYQFGVELFGSNKPEADAEIISLAIDALAALGLRKEDFAVKLNNRKIIIGLLAGLGLKDKSDDIIKAIDRLKKISFQEFEDELKKLKLDKKQLDCIKKMIAVKNLSEIQKLGFANDEAKQGVEELSAVMQKLKEYGKEPFVEFDITIARGLAYYTGTVFECFDKAGKLRSIFGGGRYDNLIERFGGNPEAATGFAIGDATLQLLLEEKGLWPKARFGVDYYIAVVDDSSTKNAIELCQKLRQKFAVDIDLMQRKLSKQFDYAASINAKKVIVVGEQEIKSGKYTVKDMKSGKEEKLGLNKLL